MFTKPITIREALIKCLSEQNRINEKVFRFKSRDTNDLFNQCSDKLKPDLQITVTSKRNTSCKTLL